MASFQFRHGFSKSQMCLQKILQIIASYPSQETSKESSPIPQVLEFEVAGNRGLGIDLNMEFLPWTEADDLESLTALSHDSAVDFVAERSSSEGECDIPKSVQGIVKESERMEVKEKDFLDQGVKESPEIQEEEKKSKTGNCFSLLVEAAEMVSGNSKDTEEKPQIQEKESEAVTSDGGQPAVENISPVVRSKRGRSQVLPSRYRDSVIEPWKRPPRPPRPAASAMVSTKRGRFNNQKR